MKPKTFLPIIIVVLLIGGTYFYLSSNDPDTPNTPDNTNQPNDTENPDDIIDDDIDDDIDDIIDTQTPPDTETITVLPPDGQGRPPQTITIEYKDTTYPTATMTTSGTFTTGQDADIMLSGIDFNTTGGATLFNHPAGITSDGTHLILTDTWNNRVLIWNTFPTEDTAADIMLEGLLGTPRHITSNGECLIVGDHNPKTDPPYPLGGTFVYNTFPTEDSVNEDYIMDGWYRGCWDNTGNLILAGEQIRVYHEVPTTPDTPPDVRITDREDPTRWISIGDYGGVAVAGDRAYVCTGNGNKILVYEDTPTGQQHPDFVIGAPSLETDTLLENNYLTNPVPASDEEHLFVSSDFDRMLYVWKNIPDISGATPDITYKLDFAPWDNVVYDNKLIIAGAATIYVWNSLPLDGEIPDHVYCPKNRRHRVLRDQRCNNG